MDIKDFYFELKNLLLSEQVCNISFRDHLSISLKKYRILLNNLDSSCHPENWDGILKSVDKLSNTIKEVVKRYYLGHQALAFSLFNKQISQVPQLCYILQPGMKWYRMRSVKESKTLHYNEMFHIPLCKRGIIKTERYSFPGYPCLYLGASVYVCWEELHRPSIDLAYVSQLENVSKINVLDMTIPELEEWTDASGLKRLQYQLTKIPLLIASMIKVRNPDDIFKPEYIIPQLLMEVVLHSFKSKNTKFDGIIYSSVCENKDYNFNLHNRNKFFMCNLAIPVRQPLMGMYCHWLTSMFKITNPTSDELERTKCLYDYPADSIDSDKDDYQYSVFGQLEKRLSNRKRYPLYAVSSQK